MGIVIGKVNKADAAFEALRRLRLFLDREEPALVQLLVSFWQDQAGAITYKELREVIIAGHLNARQINAWNRDYARFVANRLKPKWDEAILTALEALKTQLPDWTFNMADDIDLFTQQRSGNFVTRCTNIQHEAINALIERAAIIQDVTPIELSRAIRPLVGLTRQQALRTFRLYEKLRSEGRSQKAATDQCARLAARQHRYRGLNIARTELAWAYNKGEYEGVMQAQRDGLLGPMKKVWCTADDERVCDICSGLDQMEFAMGESIEFPGRVLWEGFTLAPPAHCSCRCVVLYEEI